MPSRPANNSDGFRRNEPMLRVRQEVSRLWLPQHLTSRSGKNPSTRPVPVFRLYAAPPRWCRATPCNESARRAAIALGSNVRHAMAIDDLSSRNGGQEVSTDPKVYPGGGTGRAKTPRTPALRARAWKGAHYPGK